MENSDYLIRIAIFWLSLPPPQKKPHEIWTIFSLFSFLIVNNKYLWGNCMQNPAKNCIKFDLKDMILA